LTKSTSSTLLKLKKLLTLAETAKHLSIICGEEVSEADILRLALDGQLILSVNFVNPTFAKIGKVVDKSGVIWGEPQKPFIEGMLNLHDKNNDKSELVIKSTYIGAEKYLNLNGKVTTIDGVWDLPMIGDERLDIENRFQSLTNGPEVTEMGFGGIYVDSGWGIMGMLQEYFGKKGWSNYQKSQYAKILKLERNNCNNRRRENILIQRKERFRALCEENDRLSEGMYLDSSSLPKNCVLVVRTRELRKLEQKISNGSNDKKTPTKEHGGAERHAKNREQVLGAALHAITKWPEECINKDDKHEAAKIAKCIEDHSVILFPETGKPPLSLDQMTRKISEWINMKR